MKRAAMTVAVLAMIVAAVYGTSQVARASSPRSRAAVLGDPTLAPRPPKLQKVTIHDVLRDGPVFGIQPNTANTATVDAVTRDTGCRPGWVEVFSGVDGAITASQLAAIPGVPVVSIEPWQRELDDPMWTLASTIKGDHDSQYSHLASVIRDYGRPVLIRFAHEMNGRWYPWGAVRGNSPVQYVAAWRHVVVLFRAAATTNALWIWSPNILRGAVNIPLSAFYPGDAYVDFVGLTGYGEFESTPDDTYGTTLIELAAITRRPLILTEVGVRPSSRKPSWIEAFGPWLADHSQIVSFLWTTHLGRFDWRFDDTPTDLAAFRSSLRKGHVQC